MRFLSAMVVVIMAVVWAGVAYAGPDPVIQRTIEYEIYEPCDVLVAAGEVVLNWDPCGGDYEVVSIEYEDYPHPLSLLFYAGSPDFCDMDPHAYASFFCGKACKGCEKNVYCMDCNPCDWWLCKDKACWCGEWVCWRAFLPNCMELRVVDVW